MLKNTDVLDNYEALVISVEEIREALDLLRNWLNCTPNMDDWTSYHDLVALHGQHFALLNLVMDKINYLISMHQKSIDEHYIKE